MKCIILNKCFYKLNKKWQNLMCTGAGAVNEQYLINIKHFGSFFPSYRCSIFKIDPLDDLQICLIIQCCKHRFCFFNYIHLSNNILLFDN